MKKRIAKISGESIEAPEGAVAYKYADPTEDARWLFTAAEVREIEREDPGLIEPVVDEETPTREEIAGSFALWSEYVDPKSCFGDD